MFIDDLITQPDLQAKGYASALLKHVAVRAAAEGWPRIYLDARQTARSFYEKLGYRAFGKLNRPEGHQQIYYFKNLTRK